MKPIHALLALLAYLLGRAHGRLHDALKRPYVVLQRCESDDDEERYERMHGGE